MTNLLLTIYLGVVMGHVAYFNHVVIDLVQKDEANGRLQKEVSAISFASAYVVAVLLAWR